MTETPAAPAGYPAAGLSVPSGGNRLTREFGYLLAGLPVGIVAFVLAVTGFSAGVSTLVVWIGLPILVGSLHASRGLAAVERRAARWVTGRELPPHHYRPARGHRVARRLLWALADPQSWRDLLHSVVAFPVRVATFSIAVSWAAGGLGGTLYLLWEWSLPSSGRDHTLYWLITGSSARSGDIALTTAIGVVLLLSLPWVVRGLVAAQTGLARGLLTNQTAALRARAEQLAVGRRAAVQAEAQTLRRLERDIHDGPQQRLVRLNMDLETAARRLDDDPQRARPLIDEALEQSREALSELRTLSRGIAPPILADRGLGAALLAAAARCPVPVSLAVTLPGDGRPSDGRPGDGRLGAAVENTAYFVVTEALTNVAKHSGATECVVTVSTDGDLVIVQVRDNGRGGAHLGKGHGLAGLADRLAGVDGELDVVSPAGGPTVLTAGIPLAGVGE
ncbi:MAG: sensor histidine kinase [Pseudonocardiaceae bacterium]